MRYAWRVGLLIAGVMLVSLAACAPAPAPTDGAASGTAPAAEQGGNSGGTATAKPLALGEKGVVGPYALTVSGAARASEITGPNESQKAAEGKELLVLTLGFANDTDKPNGVGPAYFKLRDSTGAEYPAFQTTSRDFMFNMPAPVPAKGTATTKIAYEVPKGTKGFTLTWSPFVEGAQQAESVYSFE